MARADDLLDDLTRELLDVTSKFGASLPAVEKQMFARVLDLMQDLDRTGGRLRITAKNVRIIGQIRRELSAIILTPKYRKSVQEFVDAFDSIDKLQMQYFDEITGGYNPASVMRALKAETVAGVQGNLLDAGVNYNIVQRISDTLRQQITTGGKFSDLVEDVRSTIVGDGEGSLQRYAKTYANDALYTFNRQQNQIFTEDLGIEWYRWVGSIQDTSRPFCVAMNEAARGCLKFIHVSQFPELLNGNVCGDRVKVGKKTKLPEGFKANTTPANFPTNAGGWNCSHRLIPVPESAVPKEYRDKIR